MEIRWSAHLHGVRPLDPSVVAVSLPSLRGVVRLTSCAILGVNQRYWLLGCAFVALFASTKDEERVRSWMIRLCQRWSGRSLTEGSSSDDEDVQDECALVDTGPKSQKLSHSVTEVSARDCPCQSECASVQLEILRQRQMTSTDQMNSNLNTLHQKIKQLHVDRIELEKLRRDLAVSAKTNAFLRKKTEELQRQLTLLRAEQHAASQVRSPESVLRALLTDQSTSSDQLLEAVLACEVLVNNARHELEKKEMRERRSVFEQLHTAMGNDDDVLLENLITSARRLKIDEPDIVMAETKLRFLRSLTGEQRQTRETQKIKMAFKEQAFVLVKRDDPAQLQRLLDSLDLNMPWRDWTDHAGRTLWSCAVELRSSAVQQYLTEVHGEPAVGNQRASDHPRTFLEPSGTAGTGAPSESISTLTEPPSCQDMDRDKVHALTTGHGLTPETVQSCVAGKSHSSLVSSGHLLESATRYRSTSSDFSAAVNLQQREDCGAVAHPAVASEDGAPQTSVIPVVLPPSGAMLDPSVRRFSNSPESSAFSAEQQEAFRAVVQDNVEALTTALQGFSPEVWSLWRNKAGKNLVSLSEERGSRTVYRFLATSLGLLQELPVEEFEEGEAVWIFLRGEVQPRRASVVESSSEATQIIVEFWEGNDPPVHVERCLLRKMSL